MATFRVRTPAEYFRLLWQRRFLIAVPLLIVSAALGFAIHKLPNVYEARTSVIVDPPKVSTNYVQPVNQIDINSRLQAIQKQVLSRTELQRIINRYGLYKHMTDSGMPIELVIDEMSKHIDITPYSASSGVYAFQIAYRGEQPRTVRDVTAELASRFIDANSDETRRQVYTTIDQLENRISDVKSDLERIESARAGYLVKNPDAVPGQEQNMLGQMNSLSMIRQSQQSSIDTLRSQIAANEQLVAALKTQDNIEPETPLAVGQTEGQLRSKRAEYEGQLRQLMTVYTEKNPEVLKIKVQIDAVNKELEDLQNRADQDRKAKRLSRSNNAQIANLEIRMAADKRDLEHKEEGLERINDDYRELQGRLRATPYLATESTKIERDYNTLRKRYEDLLAMRDNARFSAKLINDFSGETFRMADPATIPEVPVSPKRNLLYPLSLIIGLLTGLIAAIAAEARALLTIRDARDVAHYAKLPLLVTVPRIVTKGERRWLPFLNVLRVCSVIIFMAVSVPLLYQAIKASRVLNLLTGSY